MVSINLSGDCKAVQPGVQAILETGVLQYDGPALEIAVSRLGGDDLRSYTCARTGGQVAIAYRQPCDFFYALLQALEQEAGDFSLEGRAQFTGVHAMIDVSRNAVHTPAEMKRFLARLVLCGYTGCLLYMEDTYELEGYPYFGYMRGRYSKEELREFDRFSQSIGLELIPCIQTLAHMRSPLKWDWTADIRDTDGILLLEEPKTYALIDDMFRQLSEIFTTRRFHIGMDEAGGLGRGKYLALHGLKPQRELMLMHIERVGEIAAKYGLTTMIWDDMLYREEGASGMDYFTSGVTLKPEEVARLPKNMEYVYWDYYKADAAEYDPQFEKRRELPTIFAGASWKWNGWVPCYDKSFWTGRAAVKACIKHGIKEIMLTMWADDSAETPLMAALPSVALYGESRFTLADDASIDRHLRLLSGCGLADFQAIERMELLPDLARPNLNCINSAKHLLYQDLLQGLFDMHYAEDFIPAHYASCAADLHDKAAAAQTAEMRDVLEFYARLADVVAAKAPLGNALRSAYHAGDRDALAGLQQKVEALIPLVDAFHDKLEAVWSRSCKGSGLEVLDIRIGGLAGRCKSVARRISRYLAGELDCIDELDQEQLPFGNFWPAGEKYPSYNPYSRIVTANNI